MSYHCPSCQRIIFNRRLAQCEFCGTDIPSDLRFSAEEVATLDRKMAEWNAASEQRKLEQEAEADAKDPWALTRVEADTARRTPSAFGGIAAVMILGLGSLLASFALPPDRHDQATSLMHMGLAALGLGLFVMGIVISPTRAGKCLIVTSGSLICCGIILYHAAFNEITGTATYHDWTRRGGHGEIVNREVAPVKFRQATNFLWGTGGLFLSTTVVSFILYRKTDD